jgi:hypothetical protein
MSDRWLAAAFYVPIERRPSEDALLDAIGVDRARGTWSVLPRVEPAVLELSDHVCALIRFPQSGLLNLRAATDPDIHPQTLELDPALPLAHAFRDAAVRAGCEVAILATRPHQSDSEWFEERYWMVIGQDASSLAAERYGLLYLSDEVLTGWDPPAALMDRDELPGRPGEPGRTLFAGQGWARWY